MDKVFCIGELLVDFMCKDVGKNLKEGVNFEKKVGGAPANVAAAVSKLGGSSYFLGQVGQDSFGQYLINTLKKLNISTLMTAVGGRTTLSFVAIDHNGERDFEFQRGSDGEYDFNSVDLSVIKREDIIHFGSATGFLDGDLKESYFRLLEYGNKSGVFISFDPNYRENLISPDYLKKYIKYCEYFINNADFIKLSEEELRLITGKENIYDGLEKIHFYGGKVIAVTLGAKGTLLSYNGNKKVIPSIKIKQVDSTGAGDAFVGGVLRKLANEKEKHRISFKKWKEIISYGNVVGAITCTNYGAIAALPEEGFEEKLKVKYNKN